MGTTIDKKLAELPEPAELWRIAVANAACGAIRGGRPDALRFVLGGEDDTRVLAFRNGGGDSAIVAFCPAGVLVKGFDHESKMSPYRLRGRVRDGVYFGLPTGLRRFVLEPGRLADPEGDGESDLFAGKLAAGEPEVELAAVTFAAWWSGGRWACGPVDPSAAADLAGDGSGWIVDAILEGTAHYVEDDSFAYDEALVAKIDRNEPLSDEEVRKLDAKADVATVRARFAKIGYGAKLPFAL